MRKLTLNSFRRITKNGSFIPEVDGLRFIAIISVVLLHSYAELLNRIAVGIALGTTATQTAPLPVDPNNPHDLLRFLGHGGYGVQLFFAISGFILAWPFARQRLQASQKVGLGSYFLRRVTRLEPPYILMLVFRAVLLLATGIQQARFILVHLIVSIFYLHNIAFAIASKIEAVSWTLEIEVQFYCLAPLLTLIYKIPRAWLRRTLLICAIASAAPLQQAFLPGWNGARNVGAFNLSILAFVQFFLVGLLVADLYVDGWNRIPHTLWWDLISVPVWVFMFWLQPRTFQFVGPLVLPIVFVGAFKGVFIPRFLRNPFVSIIGGMCYSIYLTHRITILMLQLLLVRFHLHFFIWLAISLILVAPAAIAVGAIYFRLIERPCMNPRWPQELIARFRSGPRSRPPTDTSLDLDTPKACDYRHERASRATRFTRRLQAGVAKFKVSSRPYGARDEFDCPVAGVSKRAAGERKFAYGIAGNARANAAIRAVRNPSYGSVMGEKSRKSIQGRSLQSPDPKIILLLSPRSASQS